MIEHVLVTGGAGFIGSHLVDRLVREGHTVSVFDDFSRGRQENIHRRATFLGVNLLFPISEVFPKVDRIYHLAAVVPGLEDMVNRPFLATANLGIDQSVFAYAVRRQVPITYVSSAMVYKRSLNYLSEEHPVEPLTSYAWAKYMGEAMAGWVQSEADVPVTVVRLFNVYGARDPMEEGRRHVVAGLLSQLFQNRPLTIWGTGKAARSYLEVRDAVDGILHATQHFQDASPVNVGSDACTTVLELAQKIAAFRPTVPIEHDYTRTAGMPCMVPDLRLIKTTGWAPQITLDEGLRDLVASMFSGGAV